MDRMRRSISNTTDNDRTLLFAALGISTVAIAGGLYYYLRAREDVADIDTAQAELLSLDGFDQFGLSTRQLRALIENLHREMEKGLNDAPGKSTSTLKMLPSYIGKPKGHENGTFYALDLGGTNFRVLKLALHGNRIIGETASKKFQVSKELMSGPGTDLFNFLADCVQAFIAEFEPTRDRAHPIPLGFTFSFPVDQKGIAAGSLITWTKGFTNPGVEGHDIVFLLNSAFVRKGVNAVTVALVNDTVGTMVARGYSDPKVEMGVILGTGSNACYCEKVSRVTKYTGPAPPGDGMIVNMEWGAFGDGKDILPLTKYDIQLDKTSVNPGKQLLEKMVSGMYLGWIVNNVLFDLFQKGKLFVGRSSLTGEWQTSDISSVLGDNSGELTQVAADISRVFSIDVGSITHNDRVLVQGVSQRVAVRAARLCATAIAGVLQHISRLRDVVVAVDGSVFEKIPGFKQKMDETIKELYPSSDVRLELTTDGSGIGSAVIAATAAFHVSN